MSIDNLEDLNSTETNWIIHVKIKSICKESFTRVQHGVDQRKGTCNSK